MTTTTTSIPEHRNPLTLKPICPTVDMVAHAAGKEAMYTISLNGTLGLTYPDPRYPGSKIYTVRSFKQRDLRQLLAMVPADTRVMVHFSGAAPRSADKLLADLTAAGYALLGVAWHHESHGRLAWIAMQSPSPDAIPAQGTLAL